MKWFLIKIEGEEHIEISMFEGSFDEAVLYTEFKVKQFEERSKEKVIASGCYVPMNYTTYYFAKKGAEA